MKTLGRRAPIALLLGLVATIVGCVQPPEQLPDPPSEELRSQLGRIGVTWTPSADSLSGVPAAKGSAEAACRGASAGVVTDFKVADDLAATRSNYRSAAPYFLGVFMIPVAALLGSIHGMATAPAATALENARTALQEAVVRREFSRGVARSILDRSSHVLDDCLEELPPGACADDFNTLLEVEPTLLLFGGGEGVNPKLHLEVRQTATLRRVSDRAVLYRVTISHTLSTKTEFSAWADAGAREFLAALADLDRAFGERLADHLFLLHAIPGDRSARPERGVKP